MEKEGNFNKPNAKSETLDGVVNVDHQAVAKIGLMILIAPSRDTKG